MTINSRQKGARGERELADILRTHGHTARRGQQFSGGTDSPDVVCPTLPGYHIECKRVEAGNLYKWLAQAKRDAGKKVPLVMHKKNREEWVVVLHLNDFLKILEHLPHGGQEDQPTCQSAATDTGNT